MPKILNESSADERVKEYSVKQYVTIKLFQSNDIQFIHARILVIVTYSFSSVRLAT